MLSIDNKLLEKRVVDRQHWQGYQLTTLWIVWFVYKQTSNALVLDGQHNPSKVINEQRKICERGYQLPTFPRLSIDNPVYVVDRQQVITNAACLSTRLTALSIENLLRIIEWVQAICKRVLSITDTTQQCCGLPTDIEKGHLSIDNIDEVFNWQLCQCCQSTTSDLRRMLSIDNINNVVNW